MKTIPQLARLALAACAAVLFPACVVYDDYPGSGGGYVSAGYSSGGYYDDYGYSDDYYYGYHPPTYRSYVTYSTVSPYYYGGRYYSHRWWDEPRYRHYRYDHSHNHRTYRKHRSSNEIRMIRNQQGGRSPQGYHSRDWYKDRGYSLKRNSYIDRSGETSGREIRSGSSRDDNRRRPSSSSRDRDNRIESPHPRALQRPDLYRYTGGSDSNRDRSRSSSASHRDNDRSRSSSSARSSGSRVPDTRMASPHPRAQQQPDRYRYTGGGGDRSSKKSDNKRDDNKKKR